MDNPHNLNQIELEEGAGGTAPSTFTSNQIELEEGAGGTPPDPLART